MTPSTFEKPEAKILLLPGDITTLDAITESNTDSGTSAMSIEDDSTGGGTSPLFDDVYKGAVNKLQQ